MRVEFRLGRLFAVILFCAVASINLGAIWPKGSYQTIPFQANVSASECFGKAGGYKEIGKHAENGTITAAGIPFHLNGSAASPRCMTTSLESVGNILLPIHSRAKALYLFAGSQALKTVREIPFQSYSDDTYFHARINYRDHSSEEVIPKILPSGEYLAGDWMLGVDKARAALSWYEDSGTTRSMFVYCIEPGRSDRIESIELLDMNDRFALALFAATLDNQKAISREPEVLVAAKPVEPENLPEVAPSLTKEGDSLIGRSTRMNFTLDLSRGVAFREITSAGALGKVLEVSKGVSPCPLFKIVTDGTTLTAESFKVCDVKLSGNDQQSTAIVSLAPLEANVPVNIHLTFGLANPGTLRMHMTIEALRACAARAVFPMIQDVALGGQAKENSYYFPIKGGVLHDRPVNLYSQYLGSGAQVQFMDIFDKDLGGGLSLRVEDNQNVAKSFELRKMEGHKPFIHDIQKSTFEFDFVPSFDRKSDEQIAMAVQYLSWKLDAKERLSLPETVLEIHPGDWREATRLYMNWVKSWYRPDERPQWVGKIFMLAGLSGDDFIEKNGNYTMKSIKDYMDMVCLYNWYLGRQLPDWFVGDYDFNPGDPGNLRTFLKKLQAQGIRTSVYTEYYCLDDNSKIGKAKGMGWTRLNKDKAFFPPPWKYIPCPALEEVHDYATSVTERTVRGLDLDGVYFDLSSRCDPECYNPAHHHKTPGVGLDGVNRMFQKIHKGGRGVNPLLATWSEEIGTEPMTQYLDLAYSYTCFYQIKEMPRELAPQGENFYRFMFPDFKLIEIAGEENQEGSRLAFFNATGIFSNFKAPFNQDFWRRLSRAFHRHEDAFSSLNVEPLVPTRREGLYANGFYCNYEKVYTLFNSNYRTVRGELMKLPAIDGAVYTDIFTGKEIKTTRQKDKVIVTGEIAPREVGGIVVGLPK